MRFYEKEVLSVPAKNTFELINKYFIHILSENETIPLKHLPRPRNGNNSGHRYYTLVEILSGKSK